MKNKRIGYCGKTCDKIPACSGQADAVIFQFFDVITNECDALNCGFFFLL